jgi:hypothetical protein
MRFTSWRDSFRIIKTNPSAIDKIVYIEIPGNPDKNEEYDKIPEETNGKANTVRTEQVLSGRENGKDRVPSYHADQ